MPASLADGANTDAGADVNDDAGVAPSLEEESREGRPFQAFQNYGNNFERKIAQLRSR